MYRLTLKEGASFAEVRDWLTANDHSQSWSYDYAKRTTGPTIVIKVFDDTVAVTLKLLFGHLFK